MRELLEPVVEEFLRGQLTPARFVHTWLNCYIFPEHRMENAAVLSKALANGLVSTETHDRLRDDYPQLFYTSKEVGYIDLEYNRIMSLSDG